MVSRSIHIISLVLLICITALSDEPSTTGKPDNSSPKRPDQLDSGRLLSEAGLGHLSEEDQDKARKMLANVVATIRTTDRRTADIASRAERYFEAEGFIVLYLKVISVRGEDWLVVSTGLTTSATKDLPLMFPALLFKEGHYFCKPAFMGGINEMIDDSGRTQSFMFAEWKDLH